MDDALDDWLSKVRHREAEKVSSWRPLLFDSMAHGMELDENDDERIARVALPGLEKKDFKVEVAENRLVIRSGNNRFSKRDGPRYSQHEEISTSCAQAISLPCEINHHRVKAKYKNGLLTVTLPKSEGPRNKRLKIRVA